MFLRHLFYGAVAIFCAFLGPTWADFNADGAQNLFVYFAQSSGRNASLSTICSNAAVDVVILGFVRSFADTAGYPTVDFGPWVCSDARPANATVAPGMAICTELGKQVRRCQELGKKIYVSIGGSTSNTSFGTGVEGRQAAKDAAKSMWELFGEGTTVPYLRPFGRDVVVDGFDIDHEVGSPAHYDTFVSALHSYLASASKPMYISAAPTCDSTNRPISGSALALVDFIFIRFYNKASCSLGTPAFRKSLRTWYEDLVPSPLSPSPKILLGGLSFDNDNLGFVSPESFGDAIRLARSPDLLRWNEAKFGGVMLWDGPRGLAVKAENGLDFLAYTKAVLAEG
ncbi:glycoside hydrolase superfamily [Phyllosticta citrichinensis]|uniref:chitinase n=1 Tax=Phyllosticta citrichinensis TaxID=1130410 RepID=A0ABR1XSI1_9PEZI